jgi:stage II sporulation protein AB (anti-sigma F factor)
MKRKNCINYFKTVIYAASCNEAYSRIIVSAFASQLDPTVEEIADIKTAVSEAVTNCIVHAYGKEGGEIILRAKTNNNVLIVEIEDKGIGIENIKEARKPFFTTKANEERSGMGFTVMETFMDTLEVRGNEYGGTTVEMSKKI